VIPLAGLDHRARVVERGRQWFLAKDVRARLGGHFYHRAVTRVLRADHHAIRLLRDQRLVRVEQPRAILLREVPPALGVVVRKPDQLNFRVRPQVVKVALRVQMREAHDSHSHRYTSCGETGRPVSAERIAAKARRSAISASCAVTRGVASCTSAS